MIFIFVVAIKIFSLFKDITHVSRNNQLLERQPKSKSQSQSQSKPKPKPKPKPKQLITVKKNSQQQPTAKSNQKQKSGGNNSLFGNQTKVRLINCTQETQTAINRQCFVLETKFKLQRKKLSDFF